jgi:hypothetical protein
MMLYAGAGASQSAKFSLLSIRVGLPTRFSIDNAPPKRGHVRIEREVAMIHSDIVPQHLCNGELVPLEQNSNVPPFRCIRRNVPGIRPPLATRELAKR